MYDNPGEGGVGGGGGGYFLTAVLVRVRIRTSILAILLRSQIVVLSWLC